MWTPDHNSRWVGGSVNARLVFNLARRDLRGGLVRFRIFIACLALGVLAIAAIGSMSASLTRGIEVQGQAILGGDIALRLVHRRALAVERAALMAMGKLSQSATMRSIVTPLGDNRDDASVLIDLKTIDTAYPLYGALAISPPLALPPGVPPARALIRLADGSFAAFGETTLLERLGINIGGQARLGNIRITIIGVLTGEPDRASNGFALGPRLMIGDAAFVASGLAQPGSLINYHYLVRLAEEHQASAGLDVLRTRLNTQFPTAGWRVRDRRDASPSLRSIITRIGLFLTLVGVTALIVGGIGVGNAVRGWFATRRETIAMLKCLGADGALIFRVYAIQILWISLLAMIPALALGALTPLILQVFLGDVLPVPIALSLYPAPLLIAVGFGLLTSFIFALYPLGVARNISAASLFRSLITPPPPPPRRYWLAIAAGLLSLIGFIFTLIYLPTRQWQIAFWFIFGIIASYFLLIAMAWGLKLLARIVAVKPNFPPLLRLAFKNIYRPSAQTGTVIVSLGFAVALLSVIALVEDNINMQIAGNIPMRAPSFFLLDIRDSQLTALAQMVSEHNGTLDSRPIMRGSIISVAGVPAAKVTPPANIAWVLRGDRGLTFSDVPPRNSLVVEGHWWSRDYEGEPLVSIDAAVARGLGLTIGDTIEVNVLGRPLRATIHNLREIDWSSAALNFALIFSPRPLARAPHSYLATATMPLKNEPDFRRALVAQFPNITIVRVKETIAQIAQILRDFGFAVRAISVLTLLAGVFVLAGAVASAYRTRLYDAVIFKMLGARRRFIITCTMIEYLVIGLSASLFAALVGTLGAWGFVRVLLQSEWHFNPPVLIMNVFGALAITLILGFISIWRALGQSTAPILRQS